MIVFGWSGFPQYAARCVGAFVRSSQEPCAVIATRPRVPVKGMEELCGCPVHWVESNAQVDCAELLGEMPSVAFVSGWGLPVFNHIRDQVRAHGGRVIAMVDNNWQPTLREWIKAIRFRLFLRGKYDGFFVPGKSGVKLLHHYGVRAEKVQTGLYSADASLFMSTVPILERPKRILYVGQLCDRKNIVAFANVFLSLPLEVRAGWELEICGCGPDRDKLPTDPAIRVHDFVQPEDLPAHYQQARVFVLPSKEEHWGLVVHEAALSGCALLTSQQVGAAEDFVTDDNGRIFDAGSGAELNAALSDILTWSDESFVKASEVSERQANSSSLENFVRGAQAFHGKDER